MWMDYNFFIYYNLWVTTAIIRKLWVKRRWLSQTHDKWQVLYKEMPFCWGWIQESALPTQQIVDDSGNCLTKYWMWKKSSNILLKFMSLLIVKVFEKDLEIYASGYWDTVKFWLLKLNNISVILAQKIHKIEYSWAWMVPCLWRHWRLTKWTVEEKQTFSKVSKCCWMLLNQFKVHIGKN